ncbi:hypothetical protein ACGFNU_06975 [Spirillospora sp. NPDC048911]|uniref:hypothetical protein n=1 Tax=Spirillospora sp. NPDC048911 TaxID=3364527 RepID=UPI003723E737
MLSTKKLFASLTLSTFAVGGAMVVDGAAQASTADVATTSAAPAPAAEPLCRFKVRSKYRRVIVRKAKKRGHYLRVGRPIGYLKPREETIGTCKSYRGWHIVGGHRFGKPKAKVAGAVWHSSLLRMGKFVQ